MKTTPANDTVSDSDNTISITIILILLSLWLVTSFRADQANQCYLEALELTNKIHVTGLRYPGSQQEWNKRCGSVTKWRFNGNLNHILKRNKQWIIIQRRQQ